MVEADYTDDMVVDTPNRVDNSDDDNWGNDDDDDEWDMNDKEPDFVRIPSNTSASAGDFKTMHVNQIRTALMKKLDDAHDMFAMERDDMMIIIRHYKWNEDRMQQEWFDDQEKLLNCSVHTHGINDSSYSICGLWTFDSKCCTTCLQDLPQKLSN